ncbi:DNA-binding HxlR family transcriptional regulator [Nonomuraea dietziae]|uniref:DNA-binding HxlR family transcriptional regulator n=1 Tax=Nonomuraea dietziae TaxID=65515 RepID=A0A7W5VR02_9ACTN|nr:winged helix-turn-helix transcriptional regulator [Nonomuraea dietziae]MBB3732797.1 DNA-binding HxlR family transcriptional regulator [Nonomuraea dietziae]
MRRQAFAGVPARVEHVLTDLGQSALKPVDVLCRWAERNGNAVLAAHDGHDR